MLIRISILDGGSFQSGQASSPHLRGREKERRGCRHGTNQRTERKKKQDSPSALLVCGGPANSKIYLLRNWTQNVVSNFFFLSGRVLPWELSLLAGEFLPSAPLLVSVFNTTVFFVGRMSHAIGSHLFRTCSRSVGQNDRT